MAKVPPKSHSKSSSAKTAASKYLGADLDDALDLFSAASAASPVKGSLPVAAGSPQSLSREKFTEPESPSAEEVAEVIKGPHVFSVSEISAELRDSLRENFSDILIQGEIADFKGTHRSGHLYFSLKDDTAAIKAVMWKGSLQKVPFDIKQGLEVIVTGKLDYYAGSGSLQIVVEKMEPVGMGALQLKLEQLKEKLKAEGLFDPARKRKISPLNWRIGVVTSKTTAALQDMLKIFRQRFPLAEVFLFHAAVQGERAPGELIKAIECANRYSGQAPKPLDVLIITRGGGSYEDLFCFNDEKLARAIVASKIPTISAVGHEIDFTISDFVADRRVATPSHAAAESVPEMRLWLERLELLSQSFEQKVKDRIADHRQRIDQLFNRLVAASPEKRIQHGKDLLKTREQRLQALIIRAIDRRKSQVARLSGVLDALSPLKVLERGFSLVAQSETGKVVKSIQDVQIGELLAIRLADGSIKARVT